MNSEHTHTAGRVCDNHCHLNDVAYRRYWELMRGGCPEQAQMLTSQGVWA